MKKIGKILTGAVFGTAFMAAVGVYCWQYNIGGMKNIFTEEEESETIKQPKPVIPQEKVYELGESITCEGLTWNFTEAELTEDYDSLDSYYKTRGRIKSPLEYVVPDMNNVFAEETQFLILKGTVANTSKYSRTYSFYNMSFCNGYEDGSYSSAGNAGIIDGRCITEDGRDLLAVSEMAEFTLEAGETAEFEYIEEFLEYIGLSNSDYIYDLYVSGKSLLPAEYSNALTADDKVHLNIAPHHLSIQRTEPENTYDEQRDILEMKCRQWTNLDMKQYQKEGYPKLYDKDGVKIDTEDVLSEEEQKDYQFELHWGMNVMLTGSQVLEWEELPQEFSDRTALQKTAERYKETYGYDQSQMKILLLDLNINRQDRGEAGEEKQKFNFFEYSYLFTRDENEKRWVFGTADDWMVTENSAEGGRTGHINAEWFVFNQTVSLRAAYVLPPEIYDKGELYFCGGEQKEDNYRQTPIQRIALK